MKYYLQDASVSCPCIKEDDYRSSHPLSSLNYCRHCDTRRCFACSLHSPVKKSCLKCERKYDLIATHCNRCYVCPLCGSDLNTYPLLYKSGGIKDGVEQFALMNSQTDRNEKLVGKGVLFKCKKMDSIDNSCSFKFVTNIETKPQSLQEIVLKNIKSDTEYKYEKLRDFGDWKLNYERILDRKQRIKWKTEILERFGAFEVAKILQAHNSLETLEKKEIEVIDSLKDITKKVVPVPKKLHQNMNSICPSCLNILDVKMTSRFPLVYVVPMVGYPSRLVREIKEGNIRVPVLMSFINTSGMEMDVTITGEEIPFNTIRIGCNSSKSLKDVPTCMLSHVRKSSDDWKCELDTRDKEVFKLITYHEDGEEKGSGEAKVKNTELEESHEVVDVGGNWITTKACIDVNVAEDVVSGKIKFNVMITTYLKTGEYNILYECCCLV